MNAGRWRAPRDTLSVFVLLWLSRSAVVGAAESSQLSGSSVGMPVSASQIVLPGSELEPGPITDDSLIVLRIDAVYPHGSDHRYDLVYYGVEPGTYDLRKFLRRKDGSSTDDLPALPVTITGSLPPGQIEPHGLGSSRLPWLGGYRAAIIGGTVLWVIAAYLLLRSRRRPVATSTDAAEAPPLSLADRLRPLVVDAMAGKLPSVRLAELERGLLAYWVRRLGWEDVPSGEALRRLREHREAGPLVNQLEVWLHQPPGRSSVDVAALLRPYEKISPEEFDQRPAMVPAGAT